MDTENLKIMIYDIAGNLREINIDDLKNRKKYRWLGLPPSDEAVDRLKREIIRALQNQILRGY